MSTLTSEVLSREEARIRQGGGPKAIDRQHEKGRLTARERIAKLLDPVSDRGVRGKGSGASQPGSRSSGEAGPASALTPHPSPLTPAAEGFFELGLWAAWDMYAEWGGAPS